MQGHTDNSLDHAQRSLLFMLCGNSSLVRALLDTHDNDKQSVYLLAGISSVSSETEERLQGAAIGVLPSLVVGNSTLNPAASKLLNHRVPMGGGGYMQAHSYTKPAAGKSSNVVSKGVRQPVPSARASAYKYKTTLSSNASSISNAALGLKSASKYVSPYSQSYLNVLRE